MEEEYTIVDDDGYTIVDDEDDFTMEAIVISIDLSRCIHGKKKDNDL